MEIFWNQYVTKLQLLPALFVFAALGLPTFGYFYNQLMDRLQSKHEHISIYVAVGVAVNILIGAIFSWKSALLFFSLFSLSGLPMIVGEFKRTEYKKQIARSTRLRRKRLPYAANGCIEDAHDALKEAQRLVCMAMKHNGKNVESAISLAGASTEINQALGKLVELKLIQNMDE